MQKRYVLAILLLFIVPAALAQEDCANLTDDQIIDIDTLACTDTFSLPVGISVAANTVLDCQGAILQGIGTNTGITITGDNAQVRNCAIQNYNVGLQARAVSGFVESGLTFSNNNQDRDITAGEDIVLPPADNTPDEEPVEDVSEEPPANKTEDAPEPEPVVEPEKEPEAPATEPRASSAPDASIWEVATVQSEELLQNALEFEYAPNEVPDAVIAQRVAQLKQTLKDVEIEREFIYRNGETTVRIKIKPERGFFSRVIYEDITLYEYIPKCFAQLVNDIVFEGEQPTVLEEDPLLKKVIKKDKPLEFTYRSKTAVSPKCKELFRVIGIGTGREEQTFSTILAQKGITEVVKIFPLESGAVLILLVAISALGILYKHVKATE